MSLRSDGRNDMNVSDYECYAMLMECLEDGPGVGAFASVDDALDAAAEVGCFEEWVLVAAKRHAAANY